MANYQSVTVQEHTEEENISLEKQAAMQEEAAEQRNQSLDLNTEEPQEEASEERPEWLDEKFETPEDLAKAYSELQKKQSSKNSESSDEETTEEETGVALNSSVQKATEEFSETGELTEDTFSALEKAGLPRSFVEAYIAGQASLISSEASDIQNEIGGDDNYNAMADWASQNLSESDLDGFNSIVESGSIEQAKMAVKGLYAQFLSAGGNPPELSQGSTSGSSVVPFGSAAQVTESMRDPRYATDPAFRANVEKRLAVSNVL
tara:strand:+ start:19999 stop:20787 length:789 start_codon:yes stop_codon:yes gene_type:complete